MAIENLASNLETLVRIAPKERVLLTRNGEPFAFLSDASKYDWEDIGYMSDPSFWKMIRERRKEKSIPFEQIKAELVQREAAARHPGRGQKPQRKSRTKHNRSAA